MLNLFKKKVAIIRKAGRRYKVIDDVVISADTFRMERMDNNTWFVGAIRGDKFATFMLKSKTPIKADLIDMDIEETKDA